MAAVSAPQAPSLTPPSSSHEGLNSWTFSVPSHSDVSLRMYLLGYLCYATRTDLHFPPQANPHKAADSNRPPISNINGHTLSRSRSSSRTDLSQRRGEGYLAPARINALTRKDSTISETGSAPDSLLDLYGPSRSGISSIDYGDRKLAKEPLEDEDSEHSRWIHRDKLARIESRELQAAGFFLPRSRPPSKSSRRDHSRDQQGNGFRSEQAQKRQRVGSFPTEEEASESKVWDLRTPEEAAADQVDAYQYVSGGVKGVSRIPILKTSPLPISHEHLERDTPMRRTAGGILAADDEPLSHPKSRSRSQSIKVHEEGEEEEEAVTSSPAKRAVSDNSPTKKHPVRKASLPANRGVHSHRPKTRSGSSQLNGVARPQTRSGDPGPSHSVSRRPEGDPPWLATMFKPDPRLPPDQQLLPTVAKRLQQEQWEKEGKFGNTYDTDFRPLNDELYIRPPQPAAEAENGEAESAGVGIAEADNADAEKKIEPALDPNWPLQAPKSPALSTGRPGTAGGGSYSTMPRIHNGGTGTPMGIGPIPSPGPTPSPMPPVRVQEPPQDPKKSGCGCCVVM